MKMAVVKGNKYPTVAFKASSSHSSEMAIKLSVQAPTLSSSASSHQRLMITSEDSGSHSSKMAMKLSVKAPTPSSSARSHQRSMVAANASGSHSSKMAREPKEMSIRKVAHPQKGAKPSACNKHGPPQKAHSHHKK
ncbi:hypothetical protein MLD38_027239 [Melastoma candidum]|nr:hypothetical protein MLD38_027239 [Melastoma candidum]